MSWEKGKSGNPRGRMVGARERLTHKFWTDFLNEWEVGGPDVLARVRKDDPSTFLRVAASLMPSKTEVAVKNEFDQMTDAELREFIQRELAASSGGVAEPEMALDPSKLN